MRKSAFILAAILLLFVAVLYIAGIAFDWYGELENSGQIEARPLVTEIRTQQVDTDGCPADRFGDPAYSDEPFSSTYGPRPLARGR